MYNYNYNYEVYICIIYIFFLFKKMKDMWDTTPKVYGTFAINFNHFHISSYFAITTYIWLYGSD